jgi:transposase
MAGSFQRPAAPQSVHGYLDLWNWDGTPGRIQHALSVKCREQAGREASPTAAIIDSLCAQVARRAVARRARGVKSAEKGGVASTVAATMRARKSKARSATPISERLPLTINACADTQGLLMHAMIHAADVQDRDGGVLVMASLFGLYPFLLKLYADQGYQGPQFKAALQRGLSQVNLEIVRRSDPAKKFTVLPKRWIAERTIGWLNRCRRLAKDWECLNQKALAFLRSALIRLRRRKLCRKTK